MKRFAIIPVAVMQGVVRGLLDEASKG